MSRWPSQTLCAICGKAKRPGDPITDGHIVPRSLGGVEEPWNIRPEHRSCNGARGSHMTREDLAEVTRRRAEWLSGNRIARQREARVSPGCRRHSLKLPSGAYATADLPVDLTPDEAERVGAAVRRLVGLGDA